MIVANRVSQFLKQTNSPTIINQWLSRINPDVKTALTQVVQFNGASELESDSRVQRYHYLQVPQLTLVSLAHLNRDTLTAIYVTLRSTSYYPTERVKSEVTRRLVPLIIKNIPPKKMDEIIELIRVVRLGLDSLDEVMIICDKSQCDNLETVTTAEIMASSTLSNVKVLSFLDENTWPNAKEFHDDGIRTSNPGNDKID